jgi:ATP-dependent RNA helicase RhlE
MEEKNVCGFEKLGVSHALARVLEKEGFCKPTPIQKNLIPKLLLGKSVVASAQTGSGKTLAFLLPFLMRISQEQPLHHYNKLFILSPTKELAQQIFRVLTPFLEPLGLRGVLLQGGGNRRQEKHALKEGADIVIATPQRALEYIESKQLTIHSIRHFVIDEADMMFDLGFMHYVERLLLALNQKAQKVIISATITPRVISLAKRYIQALEEVHIASKEKIASTIKQELYPVRAGKKDMLLAWLISSQQLKQVMVFVRKKALAQEVANGLISWGYRVGVLHGERTHQERKRALREFKEGAIDILVATDIAARGLDIEGLDVVINYDIPHVKHDFIHRVGRTGRAGRSGRAITLVSLEELEQLHDLHQLLEKGIEEIILDEFAPKEIRARGYMLGMLQKSSRPLKKKPQASHQKRSVENKRGKKRKTTKRDGFKQFDQQKATSSVKKEKKRRGRRA